MGEAIYTVSKTNKTSYEMHATKVVSCFENGKGDAKGALQTAPPSGGGDRGTYGG